jgi:hypothetical protein
LGVKQTCRNSWCGNLKQVHAADFPFSFLRFTHIDPRA